MPKELALITDDGWLKPYEQEINQRFEFFESRLKDIRSNFKSLSKFASQDQYLGFNYDPKKKGWWYREWAPAADGLYLIGGFNNWDDQAHPMHQVEGGHWEVFVADDSETPLNHESMVKVKVRSGLTERDRIPAMIKRAVQDPESYDFSGQIWKPDGKFEWSDESFDLKNIGAPVIYECHVGMALEKEGVGTFKEFESQVLPRIKKQGYNCIQMMAVQEHPYYGSFGYHVSNFFAPSSRFGTPEDLKSLINEVHKLGIAVIMDAVYSHAVKNISEGLNDFDGSDHQYFHEGGRGYHTGWDSKLFDYGKTEVLQFLLTNVKYWIEEFHFDGFRFDGVTSMMYHHHGDHVSFDHYDKYFKDQVDWDAICFLQLANELTHELKPGAITIAEDMSGMPGISRPVSEGGIGFDFRLGMGIPDFWIKLLKHTRDEDWNLREIWGVLVNRREKEKTIAYAESHDQALVGDKTLAFWLMDKEMYWHMSKDDEHRVIDRGVSLHKMIRLLTATLGGEGYLNFIGNEFGHPEWVDFPREGNDWSYQYARRQWSLVDNAELKYQFLNDFDSSMITMLIENNILSANQAIERNIDEENKVIVFERNNLIFAFNFSTDRSIPDYRFTVHQAGKYQVILDSDRADYGGHARIDPESTYVSQKDEHGADWLSIYCTSRTALVFKKID